MTIQLIGFDFGLNPNCKLDIFRTAVNDSDADLILFPGHTLRDTNDLLYLGPDITNEKSLVVLELEDSYPTSCLHLHNSLYLYRDGEFESLYTSQIFATADDVKGKATLIAKLLDEMPRRQFQCCGKRITILQCGETALLASSKAENYKASFRFKDNPELNRRYEELIASTDIFLNPIHDLQGEQGVMVQRRATLSASGRYYLSTCALNEEMSGKYNSKRIQYIVHDGEEMTLTPDIHEEDGYVSRVIEIE